MNLNDPQFQRQVAVALAKQRERRQRRMQEMMASMPPPGQPMGPPGQMGPPQMGGQPMPSLDDFPQMMDDETRRQAIMEMLGVGGGIPPWQR